MRRFPLFQAAPIGTTRIKNGYVFIKTEDGWQYEHRLVAAQKMGRKLRSDEHAHHLDEDKRNNDPGNLLVMDAVAHGDLHYMMGEQVAWQGGGAR